MAAADLLWEDGHEADVKRPEAGVAGTPMLILSESVTSWQIWLRLGPSAVLEYIHFDCQALAFG